MAGAGGLSNADRSLNAGIIKTIMKDHFKPIFIFVCIISFLIIGYVVAITFLPIPKENQRFVDIALAFLLGLLAGNSNYLTGGNPMPKKADPTIEQHADKIENNTGDK